tara:strand:+ start:205 stop:429 length:225 start_codon:yes stop_codon:yes gene_type:complete
MPTYNYKCEICDNIYSIFQGINDKPLINCSMCSGKIYRIITGGTGMIFKGSGFYKTDYSNTNEESKLDKKKLEK